MCFEVILCHYWNYDGSYNVISKLLYILCPCAVPVFMFMSFFLAHRFYSTLNIKSGKKRFLRLLIPYVFWALAYFLTLDVIIEFIRYGQTGSFTDLLWQLTTGHSNQLNPPMWYLTITLWITLLFCVIHSKLCSKENNILCALLVMALIVEYSGINVSLFSDLRFELKYPLGRFSEMIPYAVLGYIFSKYNIFNCWQSVRHRIIFIAFMLTISILCRYLDNVSGYGYAGVRYIVIAIFLFAFFNWLPLQNVSEKIKAYINILSRYTLGIYCMHILIGKFVEKAFIYVGFSARTLLMCVCLYVLCYIIAFFISKLPFAWSRKIVE